MSQEDLVSQLAELAELHSRGLINDAEFSAAKARLLGAAPPIPPSLGLPQPGSALVRHDYPAAPHPERELEPWTAPPQPVRGHDLPHDQRPGDWQLAPRPMDRPPVDKSVGAAVLLTILFGPVGLLYATVSGGLFMILLTFTPLLLVLVGGGVGLAVGAVGVLVLSVVMWFVSIFVGAFVASSKHRQFEIWQTQAMGGSRPYGY